MRTNLYMFRCKHKLTKTEMAKKTAVGRVTYNYIENGERDGSHKFWKTLQNVFKIPDSEMWELQKLDKE